MAQPMILTYNLSGDAERKLKALCQRLQFRCRAIEPHEYAMPIGALAGIPVMRPAECAPDRFDDAMLVICHALSDQLDALLAGMRQEGVPRIPLKAVLTPVNVAWNSMQLHDELVKEHASMGGK